jgi:hypothetical protein
MTSWEGRDAQRFGEGLSSLGADTRYPEPVLRSCGDDGRNASEVCEKRPR